jgi:hypothetical protein
MTDDNQTLSRLTRQLGRKIKILEAETVRLSANIRGRNGRTSALKSEPELTQDMNELLERRLQQEGTMDEHRYKYQELENRELQKEGLYEAKLLNYRHKWISCNV